MKPVVIGNAELYLGDCREVLAMLPDPDAVITDPPYGMDYKPWRWEKKNGQADCVSNDHNSDMLLYACAIRATHSSYVFCRWDNLPEVPKPKSCVTWVKNNWSMGDLEHEHGRQSEIALFYPGIQHAWPGKRPSDVVIAPRTTCDDHPTEKPVYLIEQMLAWSSGIVCDPFMGSGTTGVACMNLNRKFVGIEIEPKYFEVACRRIQDAQRQERLFP